MTAHQIETSLAGLPAERTDTLVLYAGEGAEPEGAAAESWRATGLDWAEVTAAAGFKGRKGQALDLYLPKGVEARRLMVLGAGKPAGEDEPATLWADRGGALAARLGGARIAEAAVVLDGSGLTPEAVADFLAGLRLRHYRFDRYKSAPGKDGDEEDREPERLAVNVHIADPGGAEAAVAARLAVVEGTLLARDLVNEPANALGPLEFAERAAGLAELGVEIEILTPADMEKLGMGALLAVARGSVRPARLVVMQWHGGAKDALPVAFVGKGVVFDTGGISIKPAASMEEMKGDMGGAAAVTGLMRALAGRKARANVVGVIGLVENMPDGDATRPGDIVRSMAGTTIEIANTDAEGRLVLADALHYTRDRFKPKAMVDLATLTGAIVVALGHEHAGLFATDDALAERLLAAGKATGEKVWRMPLGKPYDKLIESKFADIKNIGGRPAGAITAAQFLKRFVGDTPWAHLDIAGTAFGVKSNDISTSWAPGFGVALLDRLVRDAYEA